jgi:hypothetical protein
LAGIKTETGIFIEVEIGKQEEGREKAGGRRERGKGENKGEEDMEKFSLWLLDF